MFENKLEPLSARMQYKLTQYGLRHMGTVNSSGPIEYYTIYRFVAISDPDDAKGEDSDDFSKLTEDRVKQLLNDEAVKSWGYMAVPDNPKAIYECWGNGEPKMFINGKN